MAVPVEEAKTGYEQVPSSQTASWHQQMLRLGVESESSTKSGYAAFTKRTSTRRDEGGIGLIAELLSAKMGEKTMYILLVREVFPTGGATVENNANGNFTVICYGRRFVVPKTLFPTHFALNKFTGATIPTCMGCEHSLVIARVSYKLHNGGLFLNIAEEDFRHVDVASYGDRILQNYPKEQLVLPESFDQPFLTYLIVRKEPVLVNGVSTFTRIRTVRYYPGSFAFVVVVDVLTEDGKKRTLVLQTRVPGFCSEARPSTQAAMQHEHRNGVLHAKNKITPAQVESWLRLLADNFEGVIRLEVPANRSGVGFPMPPAEIGELLAEFGAEFLPFEISVLTTQQQKDGSIKTVTTPHNICDLYFDEANFFSKFCVPAELVPKLLNPTEFLEQPPLPRTIYFGTARVPIPVPQETVAPGTVVACSLEPDRLRAALELPPAKARDAFADHSVVAVRRSGYTKVCDTRTFLVAPLVPVVDVPDEGLNELFDAMPAAVGVATAAASEAGPDGASSADGAAVVKSEVDAPTAASAEAGEAPTRKRTADEAGLDPNEKPSKESRDLSGLISTL